jgi:hypothetical protein
MLIKLMRERKMIITFFKHIQNDYDNIAKTKHVNNE